MKKNTRYQLKHLSIRVPWHDNAWNGAVCTNPKANGACLTLRNCALSRNDEQEEAVKGQLLKDLDEEQYPACVGERATFMAPFPFYKTLSHPYAESSPGTHGHLKPTKVQFPAFSAAAVPYHWMLKENAKEKTALYALNYEESKEPQLDWAADGNDNWVQEINNQQALLNCFFEHLEAEKSLVFFYAKQTPFVEESGRVLVGVGKINKIIPSEAYDGSNSRFGAAYWEHMILHSIRQGNSNGFLLPYHEALAYQKENPGFDVANLAVTVPNDKRFEFSYAAEHVSNDSSIRVLLECLRSLERAEALGIGEKNVAKIQWIHNEVAALEKLRGAYPGMGAALCAFGIEKGHFVAAEIINQLQNLEDNPWHLFEKALDDSKGILSNAVAALIPFNSKKLYHLLKNKGTPTRIWFLHLLSRFDLSIEQTKTLYVQEVREEMGIERSDEQYLENPYLIYEDLRLTADPIALSTIDLGLYVKNPPNNLLPNGLVFQDPFEFARIRALTIQQLERASLAGHTLLPRQEIIRQIRELSITPACAVNSDYFELAEEVFGGAIVLEEMKKGDRAYQLHRFSDTRKIINEKVTQRINARRLELKANWTALMDKALKPFTKGKPDEQEIKARKEKAAALKEIAESRFSVLIGPAGTGKTTLLTILAGQKEVEENGVLLLAPTGKARVRMEEVAKDLSVTAKTLAQFLSGFGRYDGDIQQYVFSDQHCEQYETVIMDEASMLTEEMLATTLDCLKGVKRFILVGDHRQLPPIGSGRPFIDIIHFLKPVGIETTFPRIGKGYAELTIKRRQGGGKREDMQLAEWFSGEPLEPGADSIINHIITTPDSAYLRIEYWENETIFEKKFEEVLVAELGMESLDDVETFNKTLGSADGTYFNFKEAANKAENWQILSPVREKAFGVRALNRKIHKHFRKTNVEFARNRNGKTPAPIGLEEIVYGDKIINLYNSRRYFKDVYPQEDALNFVANGEIGMVIGQFKKHFHTFPGRPKNTEIEFTSQKGYKYTFKSKEFSEEANNPLELAYALTVHKAQGSEFGKVFIVIPNPCFLLSREMLYTALTRQKYKVILLIQGNAFDIKGWGSPARSDALKRLTNLFHKPELVDVDGHYLERNLIHQASDGKMLRSKSELLIYQRLVDKKLNPLYEKKLTIKEVEKLPDFTIENDDTGEVYYWEHCGMLYDIEYQQRWEEKYAWYRENDILPFEEGGGKNGILLVTEDKPIEIEDGSIRGAISVKEIDEIIKKVFDR
ncbi:ATP-dependent RecD-like DNA helicase [Flavitalea sp. BT771]|uniref:ATP-dependent DNA helicase n=1 Tax=Flavitalea sp. BT771 TaxID=3063329 RepID=UPI0026E2070F|nr:ATP-dependent RecD-like DNA helicase [Flavitalea sp. BT771]MDO6433017.1 ATP-dependent RecD-like DNA helicase [Flavitalea sp. BT771]MDV6221707.1 ATP-dependent RecD-like DNA helicase [Flavitalea sp. BT771]